MSVYFLIQFLIRDVMLFSFFTVTTKLAEIQTEVPLVNMKHFTVYKFSDQLQIAMFEWLLCFGEIYF